MTSIRSRLDRIERRMSSSRPLVVVPYDGEGDDDAADRIRRERGQPYASVIIVATGVPHRPEYEALI